jgi:5'-nucleotidase
VAAGAWPSAPKAAAPPSAIKITILHTNDTHGEVDPFLEGGNSVGGMARRATLIERIRASHPNTLLLDAGDLWERKPYSTLYHGEPEVRALNAMGYQAMTIGNNEFPGGLDNLRKRMSEARFPVLSANIRVRSTGRYLATPYTVLTCGGLRVGVFGLTAPRIASYKGLEGLQVLDLNATAQEMVRLLKPKTDLIVALTHIGYPVDLWLGFFVPGIDIIVGGDSHTRLDRPYRVPKTRSGGVGPVVVQAGDRGLWLGELDVTLKRDQSGRYSVASYQGRLNPITADLSPDPRVAAVLAPFEKRLKERAPAGSVMSH